MQTSLVPCVLVQIKRGHCMIHCSGPFFLYNVSGNYTFFLSKLVPAALWLSQHRQIIQWNTQ